MIVVLKGGEYLEGTWWIVRAAIRAHDTQRPMSMATPIASVAGLRLVLE